MAAEKAADGGPPIPDWAAGDAATEAPFVLEVIKDGVPVDEIPLTAARCLVGRAADAVQVPLAHASISRVHACFQRSTDGLLYVADCASSHGSRLNKAPLPALKYVEARDGDVLQFGASTRIFALHKRGRERAERALLDTATADASATKHDATRKVRKIHTEKEQPPDVAEKKQVTAADLHATTWGQDDDAAPEKDDEALPDYLKKDQGFMEYGGEISSTLKTEEKSERDAKLHERLETKLRKLNAARSHNQRLLTKEGGQAGLSDGQRKAFDSNDERIKKLTDEIQDLEDTIRGRNKQRDESRRRNEDDSYLYAKQRDEEPEEEVMRDLTTPLVRARTAEEKAARRNRRFMTAAPAVAPPPPDEEDGMTYEMLREKRDRVDAALLKLREGPSLSTREAGDDVLDDFMAANDEQEASDVAAAAARDTAALEKERARLTVLMDFARPALEGLSSKATPAAVAPPQEPLAPKTPEPEAVAPTLPPPRPPAPPKLKKAAPMAPTLPRAPDPEDEESSKRRKKKKRRVMGPARGPSSSAATSALEGGDVDWAPPVGQDGSGRTALNDKFGY